MKRLMRIMFDISLLFFTSSSVALASICHNPLDFDINFSNKTANFESIIKSVRQVLQNTNTKEVENQLISDFSSNDDTSVEWKVARNRSLQICAVSLIYKQCFEITCDCIKKDSPQDLRTDDFKLLCTAKAHNDSLQDRSCQKNKTGETSKNEISNQQSEGISSKAGKSSKDQRTGQDVSPWFTTAVFVGGFVSGLIISMTFSCICSRRRRTGVGKEKPEYPTGQGGHLISSHLHLQNNDNTGNPLYSSPVYVGEYVEPVTMNGNARLLQDNQSNNEHNLPIHAMYTEPISDLCNNEYSHLQFNGESQLRTQGKKECDETSTEAKAESTENNQTEHDEDPVGAFDETIKISDEQQREATEIGSHSACEPSLSDLSDNERKDIANNANQALLSNNKENEYFVLEKN